MARPSALTHRHTTLYGNEAGNWLLVITPSRVSPAPAVAADIYNGSLPPDTNNLRSFGHPRDVITCMCNLVPGILPGTGVLPYSPVQRTVARLLGVTQQTISRYLTGRTDPDLPDVGWGNLVRLAWAWTEWPDKPSNLVRVREIITAAGVLLRV